MTKSHTGESYLRIFRTDNKICRVVDEIFERNRGEVSLRDFRAGLVQSLDFDPSDIVSREELDRQSLGLQCGNDVSYYPINHGVVKKQGDFSYKL